MSRITRPRLLVLRVLVLSLLATLIGRLWTVQIHDGSAYRSLASANEVRDIVTQPPRGEIVDDMGRPLIDNQTALVVKVNRTNIMTINSENKQVPTQLGVTVLTRLAKVLHTSEHALAQQLRLCSSTTPKPCWAGSPYEPIPVSTIKPSTKATQRAVQILETKERYPGVTVQPQAVRHYPKPYGAEASSLLGYIGPITPDELKQLPQAEQAASINEQVGTAGLEQEYEKYLHGRPGVKQVKVDAAGNPIGVAHDVSPRAGDTLVTNLDADAQAYLERDLKQQMQFERAHGYEADWSAGVVMNVRTGGIVAMASEPTYPAQIFDNGFTTKYFKHLLHKESTPLTDKAYEGTGAPGSTFKLISSLGLLHDGTMPSVNAEGSCPQYFLQKHNFGFESYPGPMTLQRAIQVSCDTFFFQWADQEFRAHRQGVQQIAHLFGIQNGGPHVDLPAVDVAQGTIATRKSQRALWKEERSNYCAGARRRPAGSYLQQLDAQDCKYGYIFYPGDQMNEEIGQGSVTVSPLEMAVAYSAMANGGKIFAPRIGKAIVSPTGKMVKRIKAPVLGHIPVSKSDLDYLRNAFYSVVRSGGTASSVFANFPFGKVDVGGKTGTAQLSGTSENGSWFISFAGPAGGKPQYVTVIEVDKADQGADGAAPAALRMWDALYGLQGHKAIFPDGVPPSKLPKLTTGVAPSNIGNGHATNKHTGSKGKHSKKKSKHRHSHHKQPVGP